MGDSGAEKRKSIAVCDGCETVCLVWAYPDGELRPLSPNNACSCDGSEIRTLGDEIFSERVRERTETDR